MQNGVAIFLSKQHGLVAVDARTGAPKPGCSMKLPGQPKNFLFKGNELVVVVNGINGFNRSALLRYSFDGASFTFKDAIKLDDQTIEDARLFDSTIVAYTSFSKHTDPVATTPTPQYGNAGEAASPAYGGYYQGADHLGTKVIVAKWDDALAIDFQDSLLDDKSDPMQGLDPNAKYTPGQLVYEQKTFKTFVTASDRYLVVPRDVVQSRFNRYDTYSYPVCTSYNPHGYQYESCNTQYEQKPNPDYKAPDPATGDYSCNGQKLEDCIKQAAPVVSQYVYVPVKTTCEMVWEPVCQKTETRTVTYPVFDTTRATEMTMYRFENDSFTKLDAKLAKMVQKTDALSFEINPLSVPGSIANRNQIQFQNGQLYVFADQALQTMGVAGNSISYLNRLDTTASTEQNPAIAFSNNRAMISARGTSGYDYDKSNVQMFDLSSPAIPKLLTSFTMPGSTSQLLLAKDGILGPGQVSFQNAQVYRSVEKLTLFSAGNGQEQDNLLLGTEYDAFDSSWFDANDDQRIRLGSDGAHLFLPYSGRHHADSTEPTAHRLNISRIDAGKLVSERSFDVNDEIIRTAALDDARSLVFGDTATYLVDKTAGDWALSILRETFVPFATYRLNDQDLHAQLARVGTKCRVTTHQGNADIFGEASLGTIDIPCGENDYPIGFGSNVLFSSTQTGASISADGKTITALSPAEVAALLAQIPKTYCYIDGGKGQPVPYLDSVPAQILCAPIPQYEATTAQP